MDVPDSNHSNPTRVITKSDGTTVEIYANGDTILRRPSGEVTIYQRDGIRVTIGPDGRRQETRVKSELRPEEKPLNVVSSGQEQIGRLMSNFAETPFSLDGKRYASVEAFYVCLKITDPKEKTCVRKLHGREAKAAGRKLQVTEATYGVKSFLLGGQEHHALIKEAIRAKLIQHPEIAQAFLATHPRPIVHDTGWPEPEKTAFPASAFVRILSELRDQLHSTGGL